MENPYSGIFYAVRCKGSMITKSLNLKSIMSMSAVALIETSYYIISVIINNYLTMTS